MVDREESGLTYQVMPGIDVDGMGNLADNPIILSENFAARELLLSDEYSAADITEYSITEVDSLTPDSFRKIYEDVNG